MGAETKDKHSFCLSNLITLENFIVSKRTRKNEYFYASKFNLCLFLLYT